MFFPLKRLDNTSKHFTYFESYPPDSTWDSLRFICNLASHFNMHDLTIVNNTSMQNVLIKRMKYRYPKSMNYMHIFQILIDSIEYYTKQWAKFEIEDENTVPELK